MFCDIVATSQSPFISVGNDSFLDELLEKHIHLVKKTTALVLENHLCNV